MDVINDSTTMQSRIDAVLAAPIMDWDHDPEIGWQPGDPLWAHPKDRQEEVQVWDSPVLRMPHGPYHSMPTTGTSANVIRPMVDIIGLDTYFAGNDEDGNPIWQQFWNHDDTFDGHMHLIDCEDCLVGIGDDEVNCWICGTRVLMESKSAMKEARKAAENRQLGQHHPMSPTDFDGDTDLRLLFHDEPGLNLRGITNIGSVVDELSEIEWPGWDDFVGYAEWDAAFTVELNSRILWGDGGPLDPYDESLYVHSWRTNINDGPVIDFTKTEEEPALPEVPRISLQDTNPDLYRPGYERLFESEHNHVPTFPQHSGHHGRPGGSRHRQG